MQLFKTTQLPKYDDNNRLYSFYHGFNIVSTDKKYLIYGNYINDQKFRINVICLKYLEIICEKDIDAKLIDLNFIENENILYIGKDTTLSLPLLEDVERPEVPKTPIQIIDEELIYDVNEDVYYQLEVDVENKAFEYNVFEGNMEEFMKNGLDVNYELIAVSGNAKKILLSDEDLFVADLTDNNVYGKNMFKYISSSCMGRYTNFDTLVTSDKKYLFVIANTCDPYHQRWAEVFLFNNESFEFISTIDIHNANRVESITQNGSIIVIATSGIKNRVLFYDFNNSKKPTFIRKHTIDKNILYAYLLEDMLILLTDDFCYEFYKI